MSPRKTFTGHWRHIGVCFPDSWLAKWVGVSLHWLVGINVRKRVHHNPSRPSTLLSTLPFLCRHLCLSGIKKASQLGCSTTRVLLNALSPLGWAAQRSAEG